MNKVAAKHLEHAREIADNHALDVISKAVLIYKQAGKCEGYGMAVLEHSTDYVIGMGPECIEVAREIQEMAENILGRGTP